MISDLKARKLEAGAKPVSDGTIPGLRLEPGSAKGRGKWTLRFVSPVTGKRRDMGLGTYPEVGVAEARTRGLAARQAIADGDDPIERREAASEAAKSAAAAMTFEQAARALHESLKPGWRNAKHRDQWLNTLRDYVFPQIGSVGVAELSAAQFAEALRPIWLAKPETASRVKQRCHAVMKWCMARDLSKGNPLDVVGHLLPQQPGIRERTIHQPSMPWRDIPAFTQSALGGNYSVTKALLKFVVLTAARSGEARAMTWAEVDLIGKTWTVSAERMKAKVMHRVPLSVRAIEILKTRRARCPESDLVFPAPRGGVLSDMALTSFLRDCNAHSSEPGRIATAHGFRSSFRDWASEHGYPRDLAERSLAHTISNHAEAAYHRTDLLEQRRTLMEAWANHVAGQDAQKIFSTPTASHK
jgi:integrase